MTRPYSMSTKKLIFHTEHHHLLIYVDTARYVSLLKDRVRKLSGEWYEWIADCSEGTVEVVAYMM